MDEEVLVAPAGRLAEGGSFRGLTTDVERYLPIIFDARYLMFRPRRDVETDPSYKQLIPYVILRSGDSVFTYRRGGAGAETRLHDLWSIGVGGHVSKGDGDLGVVGYQAGFLRELVEEVDIQSEYTERIVGLVHDDRTLVGSVHLGVVHLLDLDEPRVTGRDPSLVGGEFQTLAWISERRESFESWSQFVLDAILLPDGPSNGNVGGAPAA